ncbi:uncharacterized protein CLAFUR5_02213 [Fulvia fulva]|uniref:Uncharacterized protein n=1 Tax=Passalora fulva TaxID=5499 RepID=A0A9Q8L6J4_PASFU|nr:uncharacterized protein CLAFUR5_02213 [Fulvia fulva]KAK4636386.1 hypothetical protein CLAFUR0_02221 [Fulvia fulva]UJO11123.1 hypothetical protein CLAFUR5_02213 [Fulvia fulva]
MDSSHREPQRLSALYQYHNAPEVAPAHGLEYDDTIYPSSDKYPVVRERAFSGSGKYGFSNNNHPPMIIFGMKVRTFLLVASVMTIVVVGAAVGGAVGGQQLRENQAQTQNVYTNGTNSPATPPSSASSSPSSTFTAAIPTYTPLSDCPQSNGTSYTSAFAQGSSGDVPSHAGLHFTKYCDLSNPLGSNGSQRIAEAFVYSFSDCVEVCAGYNFWNNGGNCTVAVYQSGGGRPGNCWVGYAGQVEVGELKVVQGTDVAVLDSST